MAYLFPPIVGGITVNTNAVANTTNPGVAAVAAPGPGLALRIAQVRIAGLPGATGRLRAQLDMPDGGSVHLQSQIGGSDTWTPPEPGVLLGENTALTLSDSSDAASQNLRVTVLYFLENL